jgi:hypothetical protein
MGDYYDSLARTSFTLVMLAVAGAMALLLGVIGIYGLMSYVVSQRTRGQLERLTGCSAREVDGMRVMRPPFPPAQRR